MRHRDVVPAEAHRPATELVGHPGLDRFEHPSHLLVLDEELQARPPAVVGRALGIEPEHVGTVPESCSCVLRVTQQRRDRFVVKGASELETWNEVRQCLRL